MEENKKKPRELLVITNSENRLAFTFPYENLLAIKSKNDLIIFQTVTGDFAIDCDDNDLILEIIEDWDNWKKDNKNKNKKSCSK